MTLYNFDVDLVNDNFYTNLDLFCLFRRSQDIEQKHILTSIKGRNSVASVPNVDFVDDNV